MDIGGTNTRIDAVAISGAIALNNTFLLPMLQQKVNTILKGAILELKQAVLGENAPIVGAASLLEVPEDSILHGSSQVRNLHRTKRATDYPYTAIYRSPL